MTVLLLLGILGGAIATLADDSRGPETVIPSWPIQQATGIPALKAPVTTAAAETYATTLPLPHGALSQVASAQGTILTGKDVRARTGGTDPGVDDTWPLIFVELHGTFIFTGPIGTIPETYARAYEVFDLKTGNLLIVGGLIDASAKQ
jgi:hypothetical protein